MGVGFGRGLWDGEMFVICNATPSFGHPSGGGELRNYKTLQLLHHHTDLLFNTDILYPVHLYTLLHQELLPPSVVLHLIIMTATVNFYDQSQSLYIKVYNVVTYYPLPVKIDVVKTAVAYLQPE